MKPRIHPSIEWENLQEQCDPMNILIELEEYVPTVDNLWLVIHELNLGQLRIITAYYRGISTTIIANIEHMPVQKVIRIVEHTRRKLKPYINSYGKEIANYGFKRK